MTDTKEIRIDVTIKVHNNLEFEVIMKALQKCRNSLWTTTSENFVVDVEGKNIEV